MMKRVLKGVAQFLGYTFLLLGVLGILTPVPFGVIFLVLSLLLLIPTSASAVRLVQRLRRRFVSFDRFMHVTAQRLPAPYRRILRRTDLDLGDAHYR